MYRTTYDSSFSRIYLSSDGQYLTGLWFEGSRDEVKHGKNFIDQELPIFEQTKKWLDIYFSGKEPSFLPPYKLNQITPFRQLVIDQMLQIPFGKVVTYRDIAENIAKIKGVDKMSAQAVGGAVGWNPICILIPCHRVVGSNGSLTGYGGGIANKIKLLENEGHDVSKFIVPKKRKCLMKRCSWCNLNNPLYIRYHDEEWGQPNFDERYLLEMLILESFQAGLSWECVLNKREAFRQAYDQFDLNKICSYDETKLQELAQNKGIIRNRLKIKASVENAKIFKAIQKEYGSFYNYLKTFTQGKIFYEVGLTRSKLSDCLSADLKKKGMKFVGTTIIYSYLQAIGVVNSHDENCDLYHAT